MGACSGLQILWDRTQNPRQQQPYETLATSGGNHLFEMPSRRDSIEGCVNVSLRNHRTQV